MTAYCYGCGPVRYDVETEFFRLEMCKEHAKMLQEFLDSLEQIHSLQGSAK